MRFEKETNLYQDAAIANKFSSQDTQFNVVNGKISYLISESDIEEYEDKSKTVTSRLNSSENSIDRHSQQISSLQTDIVGINGNIDTFKSEVNTFEQTTNSTISSITSTVATKTQVWTVQPTVPYLANDFWIRDNVLYVCTVSRAIGSFNASDWKPATKGRIFTSEPTPPYYSGDAWMQGDTGEILFCNATRLTGNCNIDDWKKASKYTDDSAFNNWTQNTYNSFIEQLPSQINLQVTGSREIDANTKYTSKASIIATINDQTFESGVRINADRITLDGDATINAINGATGNVVVNANKVNLNAYATFTALQTAGATIINGANIETGTITAREIGSKTITADNIASNTITANQIASETITANEIATGTITADQIAAKTITSDEIATGTITASEIATGTITADNIASGTITADKLDVNYLTASDVDDEGSTVISGSRIKTGSINADLIKAGTLQSQDSVNYPNFSINLTDGTINIKKGGIDLGRGSFIVDDDGNVTLKKGSITIGSNENFKVDKDGTVTMKSATITGYLKPADIGDNGSTTISGNRIQTGTIAAARLDLSGVLKVGALDNYTTNTSLKNGTTTISGACITTGSISGKNQNVVFDVANGSLKMNSGSINIGNNFIVEQNGDVTIKGKVTISGSSTSIGGYATNAKLNDYVTINNLKTSGKTSIHGANIDTGIITADHLDLSGTLTVGDLKDYAKTSSLSDYATKTSLKNGTTTISGDCITTGIIQSNDKDVIFNLTSGILTMNYGSINIGNGVFKVTTAGALTATSASITGKIVNKASVSGQLPIQTTIDNGQLIVKADGTTIGKFYAGWISRDVDRTIMLEAASQYTEMKFKVGNSAITIDRKGVYIAASSFTVNGKKPRIIKTKDYDTRTYYCYETPSPLFGDIGEGVINEEGTCYIVIDPTIYETIQISDYQVFLQKYGNGDCYVSERNDFYFIVCGTPGLLFGWELKAKQIDWEHSRLDVDTIKPLDPGNRNCYTTETEDYLKDKKETDFDYVSDALSHINNIYEGRIS